jgi:hypothetical protein
VKVGQKLSPKYAGRLGGLKGGKARAEILSPEERKEIAKKGAKARWESKRKVDLSGDSSSKG